MTELIFNDNFSYKYIDKPSVIMERNNKLYLQKDRDFVNIPLHNFGNSYTHETIPFDQIKESDNIYAFNDQAELVRFVKNGKCLNSTSKIKLTSGEHCRFKTIKDKLDCGCFVGCIYRDGRRCKVNPYQNGLDICFAINDKRGSRADAPSSSIGRDSVLYRDFSNFVWTKDEYEFWSWLNDSSGVGLKS